MKKALAWALALILLLSLGVSPALAASDYYTDTEADHSPIAYQDMDPDSFDPQTVYTAAAELTEACQQKKNKEAVLAAYEQLMEAMDDAYTASVLYDIAAYADSTDEAASQRSVEMSDLLNELNDVAGLALSDVMKSSYKSDLVEVMGSDAYWYTDYEASSEEELGDLSEESRLIQEYYALIADDDADYEAVAQVFVDLVALRNRQAKSWDYDSYMEYAYENIYARQYTPEEAAEYRTYVKEYMVPLLADIADLLLDSKEYEALWELPAPTVSDVLKVLGDHISDISPELQPAYDTFIQYGLYDLEPSDSKAGIGFTDNLYSYGVPFIFNSPYEDANDYADTIHEFGHFNEMYHHAGHALLSACDYDLSEVNSQGLELLYLDYADEMVGEKYAEAFTLYRIYWMLSSITDGCMYDEFQELAYGAENLTVASVTELFRQVSEQYGYYGDYSEEWIGISHNFDSPFYYISYSVSAMTALEIYADSLENKAEAVDIYLKLSAVDQAAGFLTAMEVAGMVNPMQESAVAGMAAELYERYLPGSSSLSQVQEAADAASQREAQEASAAKTKNTIIGGGVLVACMLLGGRIGKKRRRQ